MPRPKRVTDEQLAASYARTGSVHKTGAEFNLRGGSVHERLVKLGLQKKMNVFTPADDAMLVQLYPTYAKLGELDILAKHFGRTKQFLCRQANRLGLTDPARPKPYLAEGASVRATSTEEQLTQVGESHRNWKGGWREIGEVRKYYRSRWEANYARYLEWLLRRKEIASWKHEPKTFWFLSIKRGTRSYLPDFEVVENGGSIVYHEVKGWMDDKSRVKLQRMAKYYPEVKIILIDRQGYKAIASMMKSIIRDWE